MTTYPYIHGAFPLNKQSLTLCPLKKNEFTQVLSFTLRAIYPAWEILAAFIYKLRAKPPAGQDQRSTVGQRVLFYKLIKGLDNEPDKQIRSTYHKIYWFYFSDGQFLYNLVSSQVFNGLPYNLNMKLWAIAFGKSRTVACREKFSCDLYHHLVKNRNMFILSHIAGL